jgi:hypothetical protein
VERGLRRTVEPHQPENVVANTANVPNEHDEHERRADEDPGSPPTEVSKPIGDAIPTPVEPGLDQPLPHKGEDPVPEKDEGDGTPLGNTDTPPGVPDPGPSDFA